ncbi:MAG: acyl-CoA thioesterase, partial [Candidatus Omnitrophica bacterium]|nr:acyl-CoA thioesterase [Candidatus Omnitrophota bacterium]
MRHKINITVRYAETDRMGVAYYANYLVWFEVARTEFLKSLGVSYREIEEKEGLGLMVAESRCKYRSPVTYDDNITVETWVSEVKKSCLAFDYKITL